MVEAISVDIRSFSESDITPRYLGWLNEPSTNQFLECRHFPQDEKSARAYLKASLAMWAIAIQEPGMEEPLIVGTMGLTDWRQSDLSAALGIMIGDPAYRGRGIGKIAWNLGTALAFEKFPLLLKLRAGHLMPNVQMGAIFRKSGWRFVGHTPMDPYEPEHWAEQWEISAPIVDGAD